MVLKTVHRFQLSLSSQIPASALSPPSAPLAAGTDRRSQMSSQGRSPLAWGPTCPLDHVFCCPPHFPNPS